MPFGRARLPVLCWRVELPSAEWWLNRDQEQRGNAQQGASGSLPSVLQVGRDEGVMALWVLVSERREMVHPEESSPSTQISYPNTEQF